ncbi:MAG: helix-turn-helix protein [Nocardioidaceae bacterium]|nr:helix-turn-helix protein [Nocardioidaceae bacterium]
MSTDTTTEVESVMDEHDSDTHGDIQGDGKHTLASTDVEVRRNGLLFAAVGGAATVLALAYLVRAVTQGGSFGWIAGVVLLGLGVVHLLAFADARTPLLVADDKGIRVRLGKEWRGLRWEDLEQVVVEQRTSVLHDGRLMVVPADSEHAFDDLDAKGRRQVAVAERMYGAPLVVPLGMTTQVSARHVVDALAALAGGRAAVVELAGWAPEPVLPMDEEHHDRWEARQREAVTAGGGHRIAGGELVESRFERNARTFEGLSIFEDLASSVAGTISHTGTLVSRMAHGRSHDIDVPLQRPAFGGGTVVAFQGAGATTRMDARYDQPVVLGSAAPALLPDETDGELPEHDELVRPDGLHDTGWEDTGWDVVPEPETSVPTIGPRIREARFALDMGIDELSELTAIRPHVVEAMESDDFAPSGSDDDARSNLREVARELGLDDAALVAEFDKRYAGQPETVPTRTVSPVAGLVARVREWDLGDLRSSLLTVRWALVLGLVLSLVLVWGLARLIGSTQAPPAATDNPIADAVALAAGSVTTDSVFANPVALKVKARGSSAVEIRDHAGNVLWSGQLAAGQQHRVKGVGPFTVKAGKPGSVDVFVSGKPRGAVGSGTTEVTRSLS